MRRSFVAVALVLAAACGSGDDDTEVVSATVPSSVPVLADGTVPWLDWPASDEAFQIGAPPRPEPGPDAEPCTADQLRGRLTTWHVKGDNDEGEPRTTANGLFGYVAVTNTGDVECTLQGEVPARLLDDGEPVAVKTSHGVNDEARQRLTVVAPNGGTAQVRLDWSPPFCRGPLRDPAIEIELPDDGGVLVAPVDDPTEPACTQSETHPDLESYLSSSAFDIVPEATVLDSPFNPLTVTVEAPDGPVRAGDRVTYHVVITNPTGAPIPFDPCPGLGYIEERFSMGSATTEALNEHSLAFLNCVTRGDLPPGDTRFEMRTEVPAWLEPGRDLSVTWRLLARKLSPEGPQGGVFTVTIAT